MQLKEHESNDKISVIKRMKHTRNHSISQRFLVIEFIEPITLTSQNNIYYLFTANSGSKTKQTNLRSKTSNSLDPLKQEIEYR